MNPDSRLGSAFAGALILGALLQVAPASAAPPGRVGTVFYIYMENHNWIQPNGNVDNSPGSGIEQIKGNPAAPYINSLIDPEEPEFHGRFVHEQLLQRPGDAVRAQPEHPSLGAKLHLAGGRQQFRGHRRLRSLQGHDGSGRQRVQPPNISGLLQNAGISWKSFQEDIDLMPLRGSVNQPAANSLTGAVAPRDQWTVPLASFSGTSAAYTNPYNGSHQYNFAPKHDGTLFFTKTNGGTASAGDYKPLESGGPHYLPLQALEHDLSKTGSGG